MRAGIDELVCYSVSLGLAYVVRERVSISQVSVSEPGSPYSNSPTAPPFQYCSQTAPLRPSTRRPAPRSVTASLYL